LQVIGAYVSWIDIGLVINDRYLQFFSYSLGKQELRETTCECIEEIINKGMDPNAKLKIIDILWENVVKKYANNLMNVIFFSLSKNTLEFLI
jgi:hypothetical protein